MPNAPISKFACGRHRTAILQEQNGSGSLIQAAFGGESAGGDGSPVFEVCQKIPSGSIAFVAVHPAGSAGDRNEEWPLEVTEARHPRRSRRSRKARPPARHHLSSTTLPVARHQRPLASLGAPRPVADSFFGLLVKDSVEVQKIISGFNFLPCQFFAIDCDFISRFRF